MVLLLLISLIMTIVACRISMHYGEVAMDRVRIFRKMNRRGFRPEDVTLDDQFRALSMPEQEQMKKQEYHYILNHELEHSLFFGSLAIFFFCWSLIASCASVYLILNLFQ